MPDGLYDTDIVGWSRTQAERLRRVAGGERVNDVDWAHVIEEIEDVGKFQLASVKSLFGNAVLHALKVVARPDHCGADHWAGEVATFLGDAQERFEPAMAQYLDVVADLYRRALARVRKLQMSGPPPLPPPEDVELTTDDLLNEDFGAEDLLARVRTALRPAK